MRPETGLLLLLFGVNLFNYIDRQILYAVFPAVKAELLLTDTQLGLLASGFMWVYLLTAPIFGLLADRGSRPRLMGLGVGLWSAATAFSGVIGSYGQLLLGRALVGVGEASYGSVAPAMLSDAYEPARRGRVLALFSMAIPVGSALGYLLGGVLERGFGWRAAFFVVGVPGVWLAWRVGRRPDVPRGGGPVVAVDYSHARLAGGFLAAYETYLRRELTFTSPAGVFYLSSGGVGTFTSTGSDEASLSGAFAREPRLRLFVGANYFDLTAPFYAVEFAVAHMSVSPEVRARNITIRHYEAGHMAYVDNEALARLHADLVAFLKGTPPAAGQ